MRKPDNITTSPHHHITTSPHHHISIELPFGGELPSEAIAQEFWDHQEEEHLDPYEDWKYHSLKDVVDLLDRVSTGLKPKSVIFRVGGKFSMIYRFNKVNWIIHLNTNQIPSAYNLSKRNNINAIMREGVVSHKPDQNLVDFFAQSARIFLNNMY